MAPTITLDLLLDQFGPPTLIKIDVEGAEVQVLRGAARLLTHQPTIYLETSDRTLAECRAILEAAGYVLKPRGGPNWLAVARPT